jgi:hypothetical protein
MIVLAFTLPLQFTESSTLFVRIYIETERTLKQMRYSLLVRPVRTLEVESVISVRDYLDRECYIGNIYHNDKDITLYDTKKRVEVLTKRIINGLSKMESRREWVGLLEVKSLNEIKYKRIDVPDLLETTGNKESIEVFCNLVMIGQIVKM